MQSESSLSSICTPRLALAPFWRRILTQSKFLFCVAKNSGVALSSAALSTSSFLNPTPTNYTIYL